MKIAIPTSDGLTLSANFGQAKGFLILTLELGEIVKEEMRWNKLSDILCSPDGILNPITDCQAVMANHVGNTVEGLLTGRNIDIFHTTESIITNAYVHFLESKVRKEANTCCCP
jgi:predicted Fe-Mo cluster-binding NifX family protein